MRRTAIAVLLATIPFLPLTGTVPAQANDQTPCSFKFNADVNPGLSNSPSSGTVTSNGQTGTITCQGKVNGKTVTGPGTYGVDGRYGTNDPDTCTSGGEGNGTASMTIPTSDGPQRVTAPFTYTYGALQNGILAVTFKGETWSGTAEVRPTKGDCASAPLTRMTAEGKGTLTS
jgi:hypothetical protein